MCCDRATGSTVWESSDDCSSLRPGVLRRQQRLVCSKHVDLMEFVSQAARTTVDLCQELFAERRWNCSSIQRAPKFRRDLTAGKADGVTLRVHGAIADATVARDFANVAAKFRECKVHKISQKVPEIIQFANMEICSFTVVQNSHRNTTTAANFFDFVQYIDCLLYTSPSPRDS